MNKLIVAFDPTEEVLKDLGSDFQVISDGPYLTSQKIIELATTQKADAILLTMGQQFGSSEIAKLPKSVKIVATCSVGFDHLDVKAFNTAGIYVTNTPDVLTDATADLAFSLLLNATRRVKEYLKITELGWGKKMGSSEMLGLDIREKNLGILGMGRIGQAMAHRARAFGAKISYCNRTRLAPELEQGAKYFPRFEDMLPECQILSLHAPGTPETTRIMGLKQFELLPKDAIFINVARGTLVDEEALFKVLESGHLFAAGLDVCLNEPNPDKRFLNFPNVMLTPHVGSATRETRTAMGLRALENVQAALTGKVPRDSLN